MLMSIATNVAVITGQPQIQNKTEEQQPIEQQFLIAKARIVEAQRQQVLPGQLQQSENQLQFLEDLSIKY
jgi:hypothetical protein